MSVERDWQAEVAKWGAVMTAAPRWVGAMMEAEGVALPETWRPYWRVAVVILTFGMAVTEAMSFAYIFNSWRTQKDKTARNLIWLAAISAVIFVVVLAPYIAAQVKKVPLAEILATPASLWAWAAAVAASTIMIVVSVGYAQRYRVTTTKKREPSSVQTKTLSPYAQWGENKREERLDEIVRFVKDTDPDRKGVERDAIFDAVHAGRRQRSAAYKDIADLVKENRLVYIRENGHENTRRVTWKGGF